MTPQIQQTPNSSQIFLDHVGWFVPDMEVAARAFEKLGFTLTPFSVHGDRDPATGELKPLGTANRLVMLEEGYLEILTLHGGVTNPSVERMKTSMARHVGVHLIAMTVADSLSEAKRLEKEGFALNPTINLRRTIEAEDGTQVEVAFTVIRPKEGVHPEGRIQVLTQHTPEHMWQRRYVKNDNAIIGLRGVMLVVDDTRRGQAAAGTLYGARRARPARSSADQARPWAPEDFQEGRGRGLSWRRESAGCSGDCGAGVCLARSRQDTRLSQEPRLKIGRRYTRSDHRRRHRRHGCLPHHQRRLIRRLRSRSWDFCVRLLKPRDGQGYWTKKIPVVILAVRGHLLSEFGGDPEREAPKARYSVSCGQFFCWFPDLRHA